MSFFVGSFRSLIGQKLTLLFPTRSAGPPNVRSDIFKSDQVSLYSRTASPASALPGIGDSGFLKTALSGKEG
jgi:hypothetical protein